MTLLPVWRDAPCYAERERAALAWTEAVTAIAGPHGVDDDVYGAARRHFDEKSLVDLTLAIIAISKLESAECCISHPGWRLRRPALDNGLSRAMTFASIPRWCAGFVMYSRIVGWLLVAVSLIVLWRG
ncbi:MAG: hypothetical protein U1F19_07290 [Lysobacterales bacterium]